MNRLTENLNEILSQKTDFVNRLTNIVVYVIVGLSMMCYKVRKRKEDKFRREPVKRTHGKIVVLTLADS